MATRFSLPVLATAAEALAWLKEQRVTGTLRTDSRLVEPGDAFIAWPGAAADGRAHVGDAFAHGAVACLVEAEGVDAFDFGQPEGVSGAVAACRDLKTLTGPLASAWFGEPSQAIDVLAVTGTNGKTSTAWWLALALSKAELKALSGIAVVGTLGIGIAPDLVAGALTTPDPVTFQSALAGFVQQGVSACAVEASSIGLAEQRLSGTRIRVAIFTNFTQDHLDYHGDMQAYWQAKAALFEWPGLEAAVVNLDDPAGQQLAAALAGKSLDLWTYSIDQREHADTLFCAGAAPGVSAAARIVGTNIHYGSAGLECTVTEGGLSATLVTSAIGEYNIANLLGVIGALRARGVPFAESVAACTRLAPVPGRMQCLGGIAEPLVVIDYAHTPDALEKALRALSPLARKRGGSLVCVFGCGGARDAGKRPLMGSVAATCADEVWITSDNPRGEPPLAIIEQIAQGLERGQLARIEPDRAAAIRAAISAASLRDVVLIAGKGHETTQEIAGKRSPFSDILHATNALARRPASASGHAGGGAQASGAL
jgi:UDP-N-acetylmuramyl-tripeptide synthetase